MHTDPEFTDAFNALISGEKWWVSLPKDLYEFEDEFTCDQQCSDPLENFHSQTGIWFIHIMPQLRHVLYRVSRNRGWNFTIKKKSKFLPNLI